MTSPNPSQKLNVLRAKGLTKSYQDRRILDNIFLSVKQGEIVGLLGPNGAGKTTCFGILAGLISPDRGQVFLGRLDITELPMYMRGRLGIRYLPQEASVFRGLTVEENIMAILEILFPDIHRQKERLQELLDEFNLNHVRHTSAASLSGGERRRVEIARAVIGNPHFILLDEPLAGIDPKLICEVRTLIHQLKRRGIGILLTEHNVRETFSIVDRAYVIHQGHILKEGTPTDIKHDQDVRQIYLGENF